MNFFITLQEGPLRDQFFPGNIIDKLNALGNVSFNEQGRTMTEEELAESLRDTDVCITHSWLGCPVFNEVSLKHASRLKLIAHVCASVGPFITEQVYSRGIKVSSANAIMARYVAEGTLAYMLSSLRDIPRHDHAMKQGSWTSFPKVSLMNKKISLVGLGTVGRYLLEMLKPFQVSVRIYDPYITEADLLPYPEAELLSTLQETLEWGEIISLHASRTKDTFHLLNSEMLRFIPDGALLINTSRGALIDEKALIGELSKGRFRAVLDVFEQEPLPADNDLPALENVILQPHCAGDTDYAGYTQGLIEEIERFIAGEPLQLAIPYKQFKLMTV
ncbi:hypothetical protein SY83_00500 [Paenibacillus swuensis]|uniref:Hydroxyacid dehydrogenase n=1 Tax=Paenibacillus swuensis TaxID=1178515 RepID=A0A172TDJ0_9BACL|nr:hydroxyacid dehydrogenase [Paenibacillus swuensis]ANE45090.1 hypothetical protein SY83_00500 [Paenibacillus swuensis]